MKNFTPLKGAFLRLSIALLALLSNAANAQNYIFARLAGSPMNTAGWNLVGDAVVGNTPASTALNEELIVCDIGNTRSGAAFFNTPVNITYCQKWVAEFDFRIWGGTGADGLAFCFLANPPSGYVRGGGMGIPSRAQGLVIGLDPWNNGNCYGVSNPELQIRYCDGVVGYSECPPGPPQPTAGPIAAIRSPTYNRAKIEYNNGNINVYLNNVLTLSGFYVINFAGYFGFTASTGGSTDQHSIRDFTLYTYKPILSAPNAGPDITICSNTTSSLGLPVSANDPYNYRWFPTTGISDPTIANPTITLDNPSPNPVTFTYYLTKDTLNGVDSVCAYSDVINVTVLGKGAVAGPDLNICSGISTVFNVSPRPGYSYTWSPSTGLNNPFRANPTFNRANNTDTIQTYRYILTANNTNLGCSDTDTLMVKVAPKAANGGPNRIICSGQSIKLGLGNTKPNTTYSWAPLTGISGSNRLDASLRLVNNGNTAITYTYVLTAFNNLASCSDFDTVQVTVLPSVKASAYPTDTAVVCGGESLNLGAIFRNNYTYEWRDSLNGTVKSTDAILAFRHDNYGTSTILKRQYLTVTDRSTGCKIMDSVILKVSPGYKPNLGKDTTICSGNLINLTIANEVSGDIFHWQKSPFLSDTVGSIVTFTKPKQYSVDTTVFLISSLLKGNCVVSDTIKITIQPEPLVSLPDTFFVCDGEPTTLSPNVVDGNSYEWLDGFGNVLSSNRDYNITLNYPAQTTLSFSTKHINGCGRVYTVPVKSVLKPTEALALSYTVCAETSTQFISNPVQGYTYQWSSAAFLSDSTQGNAVFFFKNSTNDTLRLTYRLTTTNSKGCKTTETVLFKVIPEISVDAGGSVGLCVGDSALIGSAALPGYTYSWSPQAGLSNPFISNPKIGLRSSSIQQVDYVLTATLNNCSKSDTVKVALRIKPNSLLPNAMVVCSGDSVLIPNIALPGYTYRWQNSKGLSSDTVASPKISLQSPEGRDTTILYIVEVFNAQTNCRVLDSIGIIVKPKQTADAGDDITLCSREVKTIGVPAQSGFSYTWSLGQWLSDSSIAQPEFSYMNTGTAPRVFELVLTKLDSLTFCKSRDTLKITVAPELSINLPDTITVCSNSMQTIGVSAIQGYTYSWGKSPGIVDTSSSLTRVNIRNLSGTATYYKLGLKASFDKCSVIDSTWLKVLPQSPSPSISGDSIVCPGSINIVYAVTNPQAGFTYRWLVEGGLITSVSPQTNSIELRWLGLNPNAAIKLIATNNLGCDSDTSVLRVKVQKQMYAAKPRPTLGRDTICYDDAITGQDYVVNNLPFKRYQWFVSGGAILGSRTNANVRIRWQPGTLGKVWIEETTITPTDTCLGISDTLKIYIRPSLPRKPFFGKATACTGVNETWLYDINNSLGSRTQWRAVSNATLFSTNGYSAIFSFNNAGSATISARQQDAFGCYGQWYDTSITVINRPVTALIGFSNTFCSAKEPQIIRFGGAAGSVFSTKLIGGILVSANIDSSVIQVLWDSTASQHSFSTVQKNASCDGATLNQVILLKQARLALRRVNVSADERSIQLIVRAIGEGVRGNGIKIYRSVAGLGNYLNLGTIAAGDSVYTDTRSPQVDSLTYEYYAEGENDCRQVMPKYTFNTLRLSGEFKQGKTRLFYNNISNQWPEGVNKIEVYRRLSSLGVYTLYDESSNINGNWEAENLKDGKTQHYYIRLKTASGAEAISNSIILYNKDLPNPYSVITPNNDGQNDEWYIENLEAYPNHKVELYNRWGAKVFSSTNYKQDYKADNLDAGTYFYLIDIGEGSIVKGWLEILK